MARILITGGAGFIGSHTADALIAAGHGVRVLDNLDPQVHPDPTQFPAYLHPDVERMLGDVRDRDAVRAAVRGMDAVFHFAALTGVGQSLYERERYEAVNGYGTLALLDVLAEASPRPTRLVLSSSRAVYGEGRHVCPTCGPLDPLPRTRTDMESGVFDVLCPRCGTPAAAAPTPENRPLRPVSIYGQTKAWQEVLCRGFARESGASVVALRYFNVYGSRQSLRNPYTGVMSIFLARIREGQPIEIYENGTPTRDFVHVSDVVRANLLALDAEVAPGTAINIGTGLESRLRDVATRLADALGGQRVAITDVGTFRVGDLHACHADISRARRVLGYAPQVDLTSGIAEFLRWAAAEESLDLSDWAEAELAAHDGLGGRAAVART